MLSLGKVLLDIARANPTSADLDIAIRNELRTLREESEKFKFWLPEGVGINPEELANWWTSLDYTGRTAISSVGIGETPQLKEEEPLALDKKFEAELRRRADVPGLISKLRKMAALGNMVQGKSTPSSLGFVATTPDTTARVDVSGSDPVENTAVKVEQQLLDNANSVTLPTLQNQIPQDEAVNSTVLPLTASNTRQDPNASAEENSITLGQNEWTMAETVADKEQGAMGSTQRDSPFSIVTNEGDGLNLTTEANNLSSCEPVDSPAAAGSDLQTDDHKAGSLRIIHDVTPGRVI